VGDGGLPIPVAGTVSARLLAADVGAGIWPADGSLPGPPPDGGVGCVAAAPPPVAAPPARDPSLSAALCAAATSIATDAARAATVNIPSTDLRMESSAFRQSYAKGNRSPLGTPRNDNKRLGKTLPASRNATTPRCGIKHRSVKEFGRSQKKKAAGFRAPAAPALKILYSEFCGVSEIVPTVYLKPECARVVPPGQRAKEEGLPTRGSSDSPSPQVAYRRVWGKGGTSAAILNTRRCGAVPVCRMFLRPTLLVS
jgi:hypothetical protein